MSRAETGDDSIELLYEQPVLPAPRPLRSVTTVPCEVCGVRSATVMFTLPGTRFETIRCDGCGLGSLSPPPTPEEVGRFYPAEYYGAAGHKFTSIIEALVRLVAARHVRFLARQIRRGGRVLDVGCGRGVTLSALADAGFEAHGFEVSPVAAEGVDHRVSMRIADSLPAADYESESFDGAVIWHVLEHVPAPRATIAELQRILKPGGVLVVAVPNFSSWQARWAGTDWFHLDPPRHLFHFPLSALKQLLISNGFECLSEHHFSLRQNPFGWIQSALNKCRWLPRNSLYLLLHRRSGGGRVAYSWQIRLQLACAVVVLSGLALVLSVLEAVFRQGATVHVVCRKQAMLTDR